MNSAPQLIRQLIGNEWLQHVETLDNSALFGQGRRANMPWWGGFDPRVWELGSVLDFLVPIALCTLVFVVARRANRLAC